MAKPITTGICKWTDSLIRYPISTEKYHGNLTKKVKYVHKRILKLHALLIIADVKINPKKILKKR